MVSFLPKVSVNHASVESGRVDIEIAFGLLFSRAEVGHVVEIGRARS